MCTQQICMVAVCQHSEMWLVAVVGCCTERTACLWNAGLRQQLSTDTCEPSTLEAGTPMTCTCACLTSTLHGTTWPLKLLQATLHAQVQLDTAMYKQASKQMPDYCNARACRHAWCRK